MLDLLPDCIDHATVGAAREEGHGAVLMRDVGRWLIPAGDAPVDAEQHLRFLDHLATLHAACWGWHDDVGLVPVSNRYSFFGPDALDGEAALGFPQPVPRIATEGWQRLDDASPELAARVATAPPRALGAVRRPGRDAQDPPPRRHQVLEPRDAARRAHGLRRLVDDRRGSAARRDRALARAQPGPPPARTREGRDRRGLPRRARAARRRHRAVVRASAGRCACSA